MICTHSKLRYLYLGQKVATLLSCRTYNSYSLNIDPLFTKFRVKKIATENNYREIQAKGIEIIIINILSIKLKKMNTTICKDIT